MNEQQHNNGPFPAELLVSIFIYLDGPTLACCSQTCRQWNMILTRFDQEIWPHACRIDFERSHTTRRFWSLQFPSPKHKRSWQDMYRITRNWYTGFVHASYPPVTESSLLKPCTVIGAPQEQGMFTNLTLAHDGRVIRSNPNYHSPTGSSQSLMIQSPQTKQRFYLQEGVPSDTITTNHSIVCHYTHPSSKWLVTGGLNGTVALWDLTTKSLVRMWNGHRGRVLCISMNGEAVVSGGSDSMIRVWDLDKETNEWTNHQRPTRRGMIDISSYLSGRSDWYQGVGEIALNGHLVACAPDASGPILVFSLLTGSLVYELRVPDDQPEQTEWATEDITAFTRLVLTPFFLLTKGKIHHQTKSNIKLVPSHNVVHQRIQQHIKPGYITTAAQSSSPPPPVAQMTPYQLYQYYKSVNTNDEPRTMPTTSACINVWDLQTGKIAYRLVPTLDTPHQNYTLTDIRVTQDFSKVFASIEIRGQKQYQEKLFCWDFNLHCSDQQHEPLDIIELDGMDPVQRKTGKSWVCFM